MYYAFDGATPPPRAGASHSTIYPYGPFPTGDGGTVMLGLQNEREWQLFCEKVMEQPALARDERFDANFKRSENRAALRTLIDEVFAELSAEQVIERLESAQIANAHVNDMAGVWQHPQLAARDRWRSVMTPGGEVPAALPPGRNAAYEPRMDAVPALGQHSEAILKQLGYADEDVDKLRQAGTI